MNRKVIISFLIVLMCSGCGSIPIVRQVEVREPITIKPDERAQPILFKRTIAKLKVGEKFGKLFAGVFCIERGTMVWQAGRVEEVGNEFSNIFREEMRKANYPIIDDPDEMFDSYDWQADLIVIAAITKLETNICLPWSGFDDMTISKGSAYIKVDWQVYSRLNQTVIYKKTTEGSSTIENIQYRTWLNLFFKSFSAATRSLLADKGFHDLVLMPIKPEQEDNEAPIKIIGMAKPFNGL
jgi:hypothetical protein